MIINKWLLCPKCGNKTRDRIREDTILINYPLFCPKCKQETLINVKQSLWKPTSSKSSNRQKR